ncbi:hypothetical protein [Mesorhizobium sp.]|uniref:hypothetical protein n=1 Tax=Mesorhizobium sp. TaxID=1871066 RepID=UPI000FE81FBB|nr:hypothetical protein [Mesorhizobium sp.]RWK66093.1 MAG: hypothetical protein EOR49_03265 [Mesorhizobium sp.]RWM45053.1 MAG: hypothetical protein EOR76_22075 [Mesorhizobium sp.]RWM53196.1 MAG: hypothetical protein EOR78_20195 [Mesorhizobium sp.]RWM62483.1 MAG: hypothetical protein EOR79_02850 [Mesorhizobium sp.]RWN00170.1 MAG: hypothetical protein EOR85_16570 [Mesorhizobium sp.]
MSLLLIDSEGRNFAIEIEPQVVAPMIAIMSAHGNELRAALPRGEDLPIQALDVKNFTIAMTPEGDLGWQIELSSGVLMVLKFSKEQFRALDGQMTEVRQLVDRIVQ